MIEDHVIAVVVPAYNEGLLLARTLEGIPDYVDHVVVVDDASLDDTFEVAMASAKRDPRVEVVRLGFNRGVGFAIMRGYARGVELGATVLSVMAGDNQMDPSELRAVIDPVVAGEADYAKGNRLAHPEIGEMPKARYFGTWVLGLATGWIAGWPQLRDSQCGYTALSAQAFSKLPVDQIYPRYGYPNDLLLRLSEQGARLAQPVVRPVYAEEVSGFKIRQVVGPIGGILARGAWRRLKASSAPRP